MTKTRELFAGTVVGTHPSSHSSRQHSMSSPIPMMQSPVGSSANHSRPLSPGDNFSMIFNSILVEQLLNSEIFSLNHIFMIYEGTYFSFWIRAILFVNIFACMATIMFSQLNAQSPLMASKIYELSNSRFLIYMYVS